jgi:hypothetical protein
VAVAVTGQRMMLERPCHGVALVQVPLAAEAAAGERY